ncbi:MAG TPA: ATP-binding protein [Chthoniobacteraceae bacterium]|nr:ATP-binding protein [Chthoniobacteraceae bacterium]
MDPQIDLDSLVEHCESVSASQRLEDVYRYFEEHGGKFVGVIANEKLVGIASRAKIGFLLGSRYGFSMHGRKPVGAYMLQNSLHIRLHTPLLEVLDVALSREGDEFHDDVALVDKDDRYLGMIPMQRLVRLQSQLISEKTRLAEEQQKALAAKNQQLFASLHQLRQSQGRYDILFENSALGVALLSPAGEIETCNQHAGSLLGLASGDEHMPLLEFMEASSRRQFLLILQQHEKHNGNDLNSQAELKLNLKGRGRRLFKFFTSWIKETGQVCVLLDDITEQRKLELKAAQEERSATMDTLAGGVAHEINNKLAPILGFSELLLADARRTGKSSETLQYCSIIRECAIDSSKIISQLLQISRPPTAEKQCCDLREITEQVVAILRFQIRQSEADLSIQTPKEPAWISADAGQIKQVIINLVINSLQAVENREKRRVTISVAAEGEFVALQVEDTGNGIPPEHLKRVFDPFFTTKSFNHGTGLGLSICASIVQRHSGEIQIDSTPGIGTTVKVQIPAATITPLASPMPAPAQQDASASPLDGAHVLVVDDEEYVACAVQETLRLKTNCSVERVGNGLQAIERLRRKEFHLVISDVRMPGMNGFDLFDWIAQNQPGLTSHFLFITGDAGNAELNDDLTKLGVPVLRKPFSPNVLLEECRPLVKKSSASARMIA